jgi:hypothetical protein
MGLLGGMHTGLPGGSGLGEEPDYLQTTTITEVPPSLSGQPMPAAAAVGGRAPMAAGTSMFGPGASSSSSGAGAGGGLVLKVESPVVDELQQPRVDSPPELDMDAGVHDLLANLSSVPSAELMLTDELSRDDLWDVLFGKGGAGGGGDAAAAAAMAGLGPNTGSLLGGSSSLDAAMAAYDAQPQQP